MESIRRAQSELFLDIYDDVLAGFEIAERIIENDMTHHYFIMDGNVESTFRMVRQIALFKAYYNGSKKFFDEEKYGKLFKIRWVIKKATVVIKKEFEAIARLSDAVDEIISLPDEELEQLSAYAKTIIYVHENIHRDEYGSGRDECDEALKMKMFGVSSYRFELRVPMNIPDEDKIMDSAIIVPAKTEKTARELLSQYEYNVNTAVICNGVGRNKGAITDNVWEDVIKKVYANGMQVCQFINDKSCRMQEAVPMGIPTIKADLDVLAGLLKLGVKIIGGCTEDVAIATYMNYTSQAIILSDSMEQNMAAFNKLLGKRV